MAIRFKYAHFVGFIRYSPRTLKLNSESKFKVQRRLIAMLSFDSRQQNSKKL